MNLELESQVCAAMETATDSRSQELRGNCEIQSYEGEQTRIDKGRIKVDHLDLILSASAYETFEISFVVLIEFEQTFKILQDLAKIC